MQNPDLHASNPYLILGILFIINSSNGHQLVFHHPQSPKIPETREIIDGEMNPLLSYLPIQKKTTNALDTNASNTTIEIELEDKDSNTFLGYDLHFLTNLLAPKLSFCNQVFHLQIDDFIFIGYPMVVENLKENVVNEKESSSQFMFHLCFVFYSNSEHNNHYSLLYDWIKRYAEILKQEQQARDILKKECDLLLNGDPNESRLRKNLIIIYDHWRQLQQSQVDK